MRFLHGSSDWGIQKNIQKWKKNVWFGIENHPKSNKPTKNTSKMLAHIRHGIIYCIICFIILSYIVSCILLFYHILYHIVSAICIQSVLPGRQSTQDLLVDYRGDPWRSVEPLSFSPKVPPLPTRPFSLASQV